MKDNRNFQITSRQLLFMIVGSTIGTGILTLPRVASADAEQNAWMAVIFGGIVPIASLFLMERLGRRFPNLTIIEMTQLLLGKFIGSIIIGLFIIYIVFIEGIILRLGSEIISMYTLPKTPIQVTSFIIIIAIIYIAKKGAKVIGRLNEILFFILLLNFLLLLPIPRMMDYTNLLPVGGVELMGIAKASFTTGFAYQGIEIVFITYPMIARKERIFKVGIYSLLIIMFFYLQVTVAGLLIFGVEVLERIMWPVLTLLKVFDIPVFERLEIIFLILWTFVIARPIINHSFTASFSLAQLFKLDINKYYSLMVTITGISIYSVSLIPRNIVQTFSFSEYAGYGFYIFSIGYPLLLHLVALIRKGKVQQYG